MIANRVCCGNPTTFPDAERHELTLCCIDVMKHQEPWLPSSNDSVEPKSILTYRLERHARGAIELIWDVSQTSQLHSPSLEYMVETVSYPQSTPGTDRKASVPAPALTYGVDDIMLCLA